MACIARIRTICAMLPVFPIVTNRRSIQHFFGLHLTKINRKCTNGEYHVEMHQFMYSEIDAYYMVFSICTLYDYLAKEDRKKIFRVFNVLKIELEISLH